MNNIFDTHCHPYLNKVKNQEKIIENFFEKGWKYMTIIWTNLETSKKAVELANKYEWVFASIGIHPCDIYEYDLVDSIKILEKLYLENREKIVAIWECWLDYYWLKPENDLKIQNLTKEYQEKVINIKKNLQKIFFKAQINLAKEYSLPIIIHNRESKEDILEILKENNCKNFIFHCFSENLEYAKKLINFAPNCKISFSGIVTFNSAKDIQETVKNIPLKYILAETDSPYLTPVPFRWKEENEPIYTKHIIEKINEIRGNNCEEEIFKNSINIFWLNK